MRVMSNEAAPSSKVAPPTDEASIRSASTSAVGRAGRPRKPYVQNILSSRSLADWRTGGDSTSPAPRSARKTTPDGISTTQPTLTSPIVTPSRSGAAATETQHASRPARAGRVPSIGSTTSTAEASSEGVTSPRSSDRGRSLRHEALKRPLGLLVDCEGHVPTCGLVVVRPGGVGSEVGQDLLAQHQRELADELFHYPSGGRGALGAGRSRTRRLTVATAATRLAACPASRSRCDGRVRAPRRAPPRPPRSSR